MRISYNFFPKLTFILCLFYLVSCRDTRNSSDSTAEDAVEAAGDAVEAAGDAVEAAGDAVHAALEAAAAETYFESALDYYSVEEEMKIIALDNELSNNLYFDTISINDLENALPKKDVLKENHERNLKISLLNKALYLTDYKNFNFYENNGLAYVWGGKNHLKKTIPSFFKINGEIRMNSCQEGLYGLDCSGFIYQIFLLSNFKFSTINYDNPIYFANANFLSNENNWKIPVIKYCEGVECLSINRIDKPEFNNIETGDILFFYNGQNRSTHIGVCLKNKNKLIFFDSGGYASQTCDNAKKRGPRRSVLTPNLLNNWIGKTHGIIKISNAN